MDMLVQFTHVKDWNPEKEYRYTDTRKDEQERRLSMKAVPMSLVLPTLKSKSYLVNVFDTPGHANFMDEQAAGRIRKGTDRQTNRQTEGVREKEDLPSSWMNKRQVRSGGKKQFGKGRKGERQGRRNGKRGCGEKEERGKRDVAPSFSLFWCDAFFHLFQLFCIAIIVSAEFSSLAVQPFLPFVLFLCRTHRSLSLFSFLFLRSSSPFLLSPPPSLFPLFFSFLLDFSCLFLAALRLCDGAVVVVDAAEGVMMQTERALRYCVQERIPIILLINKVWWF